MKRIWKIAAAVLCVCLLATVAFAAVGGAGGQNDPLVTLSYLNGIFTPKVQSMVDQAVTDRQTQNRTELDNAVTEWDNRIKEAVGNAGTSGTGGVSFTVVTLKAGQMLLVGEGCELILRSGTAGWASEEAKLMDTTAGGEVAGGSVLSADHLYLVLGNGVIAAAVSSSGQTQPAVVTGTVNTGTLNVRATPGGTVVGTVKKGDVVTIHGTSDGWYQITFGSLTGYVSADYITVNQPSGTETPPAAEDSVVLLIRGRYQVQ